jgi:hypothetical protein
MNAIAAFDLADAKFEQLRKLSDISRAFTYTTSFEEVARLTATRGADLLGASSAVVMLHDGAGQLQVRAAHGIDEERVTRFRAPLSDEVIGRLQGLLAVPDECFIAVPLVVGARSPGCSPRRSAAWPPIPTNGCSRRWPITPPWRWRMRA